MASFRGLRIELQAGTAKFTSALEKTTKKVKEQAAKMKKYLIAGIGAGLAAVGASALKAAKDYGDALSKMSAITGKTGIELNKLSNAFENVLKNTSLTQESISTALGGVNRYFGTTGTQLEHLATKFAKFSEMTGSDTQNNIMMLSRAINSFNIPAEKAGVALDYLYNVLAETGIEVNELGTIIGEKSATFKNMGLTFEEAAVWVGMLRKNGIAATEAISAMEGAVGVAASQGKSFTQALRELTNVLEGQHPEIIKQQKAIELFGGTYGPVFISLYERGMLNISEMVARLKTQGVTIDDVYDKTQTFSKLMQRLSNIYTSEFIPVGEELNNMFQENQKEIEGMIELLTKLMGMIGKAVVQISKLNDMFKRSMASIGKFFGKDSIYDYTAEATENTRKILKEAGYTDAMILPSGVDPKTDTGLMELNESLSKINANLGNEEFGKKADMFQEMDLEEVETYKKFVDTSGKDMFSSFAESLSGSNLGAEMGVDISSILNGDLTSVLNQFVGNMDGSLGSILNQLVNSLSSIFSSIGGGSFGSIGSSIGSAIGGLFGGGNSLNDVGNFTSGWSWGFANGGDFTVGGSGARDSQPVSFMATPGEVVSVRTPQQAARESEGGQTIQNIYVETGVSQTVKQEMFNLLPVMKEQVANYVLRRVQKDSNFKNKFGGDR